MSDYAFPALYAALMWWFTTGAILWLVRRPMRTFRYSFAAATLLLIAALFSVMALRDDHSVRGAYAGFSIGIVIWGWLELGFLLGYIMGPRRQACPAPCSTGMHFWHAVEAILYHELAIAAMAIGVVLLSLGARNQLAMWTVLLLWGMRQSAKLNLFLGVPNLGEQFLPAHLQYLQSFFRRRPMNFLFPLSVTAATVLLVWTLQRAIADAASDVITVHYSLMAALIALALLEHWFLVLPLPIERLWQWSMRTQTASSHASRSATRVESITSLSEPSTRHHAAVHKPCALSLRTPS